MDENKNILKKSIIPLYLELKNRFVKYNAQKNNMTNKEQEQREKYLTLLEEFSTQREELQNKLEVKKEIEKEVREKIGNIDDLIEETKLKNELKELEEKNKLEEKKLINEKEIEILKIENEGKINETKKGLELSIDTTKKSREIDRISLKYKILKEIYDEKQYDELIELAKTRCDEMIIDELANFKEQKNELEKHRLKIKQKIDNMKEKNSLDIQKKQIELNNYKLEQYNKSLLEKKNRFNIFRNISSNNCKFNENLKAKEIEKAKMYFEQQKRNLGFRENVFMEQKQRIAAFIRQMEINNDEYSKNLKFQLENIK
jgi:hypothetical protein